jgi:two-component system NtrC family sensor kinase
MSSEIEKIKELEEELQHARDMVFQMAKMAEMGKMVAVVVHELSQPLLGIKAFAQIIRRRFPGDDFIEPKVKMIEEQAVHMEGILDTLRQYYKVPQLTQKTVDPLVPVKASVEMFQERARKLRVKLVLDYKNSLPETRGNRGHLQQVIVNLLGNAFDEIEDSNTGKVLLALDKVDKGVRLRVADTGSGVPAEARNQIFDAFFTSKGSEKGTGLGLSICRDILRLHGGEIRLMETEEVKQEVGAEYGACFEVFLANAE